MSNLADFVPYYRRLEPVFARRITSCSDLPVNDARARSVFRHGTREDIGWGLDTTHGFVEAEYGDWLLTDGRGDWWPIKDALFRERYKVTPP